MIFLLGSVLLTSYLTLAFKICEKYDIDIFQAIVFNYITCVITGSWVNGSFPLSLHSLNTAWVQWGCIMGVLFISLFNLIGITTQKNGVAVATVANKLSLVIPVIMAVYLYGEVLGGVKIAGIFVALIAVVLTCYQSAGHVLHTENASGRMNYGLPFILFFGSGMLDSIINHVQKKYLTEENGNSFLVTGFLSAAFIGAVILLLQYITRRRRFAPRYLLAGILIGVPNYFSIWCFMKFLKISTFQSSINIPLNNMGIVLFSSIVAWILFKERLSFVNWVGILLSVTAIALIAFE